MFSPKTLKGYVSRRHFLEPGGYLELWRVAYPLIIMSASLTVMQFVDRMFLAWHSPEDVAAALPSGILYFTLFSFFSVTIGFTSAVVAQLYGAKEYVSCVRAAWSGFYVALAAGLWIALVNPLIGNFFMEHSIQIDPDIIERQKEYFRGLRFSGVFVCLSAPLFAFFSGRGKTLPIAVINVASCMVNVLLDYMFIFGKFGAPAWGIYGAGIATTLCTLFTFLCAVVIFCTVDQQTFPTLSCKKLHWAYVRRLFEFGTPAGMQVFFDVGAFTLVVMLIGRLPADAQSATTIALTINNMCFVPLLGMSDATAIVVGQYIGRNRKEVSRRTTYRAFRMATLYMICGGTIYLSIPHLLAGVFAPDTPSEKVNFDTVVHYCRLILACAAFYNFFDAMKYIFMSALRGAGDTKVVFLISFCGAWGIMVPGILILILWLNASVLTVWLFLTFYIMLEASFICWRFRSGKWRNIELVKSERLVLETPVEEYVPNRTI